MEPVSDTPTVKCGLDTLPATRPQKLADGRAVCVPHHRGIHGADVQPWCRARHGAGRGGGILVSANKVTLKVSQVKAAVPFP